jgi:hypothetical protein
MIRRLSIFFDVFAGLFILLMVLLVKSSDASNQISLLVTLSAIFPGFFLSGSSRAIVLNFKINKKVFYKFIGYAFFSNLTLLSLYSYKLGEIYFLSFFLISACSLFGTSQVLSRAWFYVYGHKRIFLIAKLLFSSLRTVSAIASFINNELAIFLIANVLISVLEALMGLYFFSSLNSSSNKNTMTYSENLLFGRSIGASRLVSSLIKICLDKYVGPVLSHLIISEQIAAGLSSIYEKYFVGAVRETKKIYNLKFVFIGIIILIFSCGPIFSRSVNINPAFILIIAILGTLPLSSSYDLIKENGINALSKNVILNAIVTISLLGVNFYFFNLSYGYIIIYIFSPIFALLLNYLSKYQSVQLLKR